MIGHIEHGSDFGGLFRYLLAEDKGARIIESNAAGRTPGELTQEFNNCADQRRTTKKPVKHLILSFSPEDGYVSDEVKARIATEAVEELGYTYNQYVVVDHHRSDPGHDWNHDHDHIHIFDLKRDKPAMDAAASGQRVSIPTEKRIAWSEIDLVSYLPEALQNDFKRALPKLKQHELQLGNNVKDEQANQQPTELTDYKLLEIKSNVTKWLSSRPSEPSREIIQGIQTEINRLKRLKALGKQRINYQKQQLEQLSPRSLLNPFGVGSDVIEQKKTNIRLNQSKLKDIQRELATANNNLEKWQKKVQVYQDWHTSPQTQEMEKLAQLLLTPDNIERLDRIEQGSKIYDSASYILKQLGTSSGEARCFQGKLYGIEKRNQTLTIFRQDDSFIIFAAKDNRDKGGIVDLEKFDLTEQDKERLDESVRYLKQQEKQKQRSKGFSIG